MRITKVTRAVAVGLVLGLLTGWLFSAAVTSTAQTGDISWCLAQHTGNFDVGSGGSALIWPGTSDGRYALVTVKVPSLFNTGVEITVIWQDGGSYYCLINRVDNDITVWAQNVEIYGGSASRGGIRVGGVGGVGQYTITFNLCGL